MSSSQKKTGLVIAAVVVLVIAGTAIFMATRPEKQQQVTDVPDKPEPTVPTAKPEPPKPKERPQSKFYSKPDSVPPGYEKFYELKHEKRLNLVTETMRQPDLPRQILDFYKAEIFSRRHWDVTRNNMANALVWQQNPDPDLHKLFIKMLEDETEDPVWRDYCLQFLSECLPSTSEPEVVKAKLQEHSAKTSGGDMSGTATLHLAYQEGQGLVKLGEEFSNRLAEQLKDEEVTEATKVTILAIAGKRRDRRMLPLLREYAKQDANASLKRTSVASLGLIGDPADEPLIRSALNHKNRGVQLAANGALKRIAAAKKKSNGDTAAPQL